MRFVLDTSIIILMMKSKKFSAYFQEHFLQDPSNSFSICFVSLGEIDSIAKQNQWGSNKMKELNGLLKNISIIPLNHKKYSQTYGEIDAYSQGKLKGIGFPSNSSARNMGKNDLWIAAVARALEATLITSDKDFEHLNGVLLQVEYIDVRGFA